MEEETEKGLIIFQDKQIRRLWVDNEWFYSVTDFIAVLTNSQDELAYWRKLKQREPQLVTICHGLKLPAKDGKLRYTDCVNTKNAFRLIQSIPSKKAEPFKMWLAQIGKERIEEIENPELAQDRVKEYYELKGYPTDWIDKRLRGIAIRQDLTDEWKSINCKKRNLISKSSLITFMIKPLKNNTKNNNFVPLYSINQPPSIR